MLSNFEEKCLVLLLHSREEKEALLCISKMYPRAKFDQDWSNHVCRALNTSDRQTEDRHVLARSIILYC